MEPNEFRKSRKAIQRMCDKIDMLIKKKSVSESKSNFKKVSAKLDSLTPEAKGEIQKRSVKNLAVRLRQLAPRISKLKPRRTATRKQGSNADIICDQSEDIYDSAYRVPGDRYRG